MQCTDTFSPCDVDSFRADIREFCRTDLPCDLARKAREHVYFSKDDRVAWQRILQRRGWFASHWPRTHGGLGWGLLQRFILIEELEYAGTPWLTHFGVSFAGPMIYTFGSARQQSELLPRILHSEDWWCQGFSEPGAGSDLAAVSTRAQLQGDHYVVSGCKTWTTMAQWADLMFALVRTSSAGRPHTGLSMIIIDMKSKGVSLRPIATIDGCHHINEVMLDEVIVPRENLIGQEGDGWKCAKLIVQNERPLVTELGKTRRLFEMMSTLASRAERCISSSMSLRMRVAQIEVQIATLEALAHSILEASAAATISGIDGSMLKIRGSQIQQEVLDAIIATMGASGLPFDTGTICAETAASKADIALSSRLLFEHLHRRATTIYGGSNEIQKNIIAKELFSA
jgi:alkylation response protein AidB-like acyl-CoA dehydrogenase